MGHSRRWWKEKGRADARGQASGSNIPEIMEVVDEEDMGGGGGPNLGWGAQTRGWERLPLSVLCLLDVEVDDHDHGADHDDPDEGGEKDEGGGEGVEDLEEGNGED